MLIKKSVIAPQSETTIFLKPNHLAESSLTILYCRSMVHHPNAGMHTLPAEHLLAVLKI